MALRRNMRGLCTSRRQRHMNCGKGEAVGYPQRLLARGFGAADLGAEVLFTEFKALRSSSARLSRLGGTTGLLRWSIEWMSFMGFHTSGRLTDELNHRQPLETQRSRHCS